MSSSPSPSLLESFRRAQQAHGASIALDVEHATGRDGDDDVCAVCLTPLSAQKSTRKWTCKHEMHASCVATWAKHPGGHTCPMCRASNRFGECRLKLLFCVEGGCLLAALAVLALVTAMPRAEDQGTCSTRDHDSHLELFLIMPFIALWALSMSDRFVAFMFPNHPGVQYYGMRFIALLAYYALDSVLVWFVLTPRE